MPRALGPIPVAALLLAPQSGAAPPAAAPLPIVELRQYTLHPGKVGAFVEFFERLFVEPQEAVGLAVLGEFRDLDRPDHFVWIRGFHDMESRGAGLAAFYGGPVWREHRDSANGMMIDSDNVLLLHTAAPMSGFAAAAHPRPPVGTASPARGLVVANIYYFAAAPDPDFIRFFERTVLPALHDAGIPVLAYFITEKSPNNFPRLPVRENEHVFVWFSRFADQAGYAHALASLAGSPTWSTRVEPSLLGRLIAPPEVLRLEPGPRSQLHD